MLDLTTAGKYNQWANDRLYRALAQLSDEELKRDRQGFFKSIHRTLNHILLVDQLYRGRLESQGNTFDRLDAIVHDDFHSLCAAQKESDAWLIEHHARFPGEQLDEAFVFVPVGMDEGQVYEQSFRHCFINWFQHQTHHRGQVHHMITHAGHDSPPLDFIMFSRGVSDRWSAN